MIGCFSKLGAHPELLQTGEFLKALAAGGLTLASYLRDRRDNAAMPLLANYLRD